MRCRLHTLLIVLAVAPPVLAGLWSVVSDPWPVPLTELTVFAAIAAAMTGAAVLGAAAQ
ncbi:MAG TPA: hypothetical protein VFV87_12805 [Pirellulaceae bacterium]|nr:hypothetical protein [Pirellulaceae bacterium]